MIPLSRPLSPSSDRDKNAPSPTRFPGGEGAAPIGSDAPVQGLAQADLARQGLVQELI